MQSWVVQRRRLFDRLAQGVAGPLTLVSAPAGSGKTTLAGSWIATGPLTGPAAWISLGDGDARPGVFWSYVLAGLGAAGVPMAELDTPSLPDDVDPSLLIRLAAAVSERSEPVVLILDNAEVLAGSAVPQSIDFLLGHAAPQLRIVLLTRIDPALPLHRYRMSGSMTEIRLAELAFDPDETRALLAAHDISLTDAAVAALGEATKGWAASLRLAALSLRDEPDATEPLAHCAGDHSDISDYFVTEVLDTQPPDVREFLLRTSLADRLWPGLAVELSGRRDAGRVLASLAHTNTFATAGHDGPSSYEYHPLIRHLLRAQLTRESPGRVGSLHRRAARWLADSGRLGAATRHACAAGEWAHAATLAVADWDVARLLAGPDSGRLTGLFAPMPDDVAGPEAAVVRAAIAVRRYDTEASARHLAHTTDLIADEPPDRAWTLKLTAEVVGTACAAANGDPDYALSKATSAAAIVTDAAARGLHVPSGVRALVLSAKGDALLRNGDFAAAAVAIGDSLRTTDAADAADDAAARYLRLRCLGQLALVEALRGQLRRARDLARKARAVAEEQALSTADRPPTVDTALAWVHAEEYDLVAARKHRDSAIASPGIRDDPICVGVLALVRSRLMRARGDTVGAAAALRQARAEVPPVRLPPWLAHRLAQPDGVQPVTTPPDSPLPDSAPPDAALPLADQVETWLATASEELARHRTEPARTALDRALRLAEPERLRRPVVETSAALRRFLRQDPELVERNAWLGDAISGIPQRRRAAGPAAAPPVLIVEPLTQKEREVLRYLSALFSTEEIARKMFVSVNTVKTHVRGVLRKLSANRRNEAVRRARDLGLV